MKQELVDGLGAARPPILPFRLEESHWSPNRAILCIVVSIYALYCMWSRRLGGWSSAETSSHARRYVSKCCGSRGQMAVRAQICVPLSHVLRRMFSVAGARTVTVLARDLCHG